MLWVFLFSYLSYTVTLFYWKNKESFFEYCWDDLKTVSEWFKKMRIALFMACTWGFDSLLPYVNKQLGLHHIQPNVTHPFETFKWCA